VEKVLSSTSINEILEAGPPLSESAPVKSSAEAIKKPQVVRSGRVAVAPSGRSARPVTKPAEKAVSSTNIEDNDQDSKEKKGLFGFGKKK
jgi:hypothetical protein